jgi:outer membrane biosynthesis protein TonB
MTSRGNMAMGTESPNLISGVPVVHNPLGLPPGNDKKQENSMKAIRNTLCAAVGLALLATPGQAEANEVYVSLEGSSSEHSMLLSALNEGFYLHFNDTDVILHEGSCVSASCLRTGAKRRRASHYMVTEYQSARSMHRLDIYVYDTRSDQLVVNKQMYSSTITALGSKLKHQLPNLIKMSIVRPSPNMPAATVAEPSRRESIVAQATSGRTESSPQRSEVSAEPAAQSKPKKEKKPKAEKAEKPKKVKKVKKAKPEKAVAEVGASSKKNRIDVGVTGTARAYVGGANPSSNFYARPGLRLSRELGKYAVLVAFEQQGSAGPTNGDERIIALGVARPMSAGGLTLAPRLLVGNHTRGTASSKPPRVADLGASVLWSSKGMIGAYADLAYEYTPYYTYSSEDSDTYGADYYTTSGLRLRVGASISF